MDWIKDHLAGGPYQLQDYSYDLLNRLDAASATGGDGQGLYNENYDYDSQGNLWKKGTVGSETVYTYLDGSHKHAVTHLCRLLSLLLSSQPGEFYSVFRLPPSGAR